MSCLTLRASMKAGPSAKGWSQYFEIPDYNIWPTGYLEKDFKIGFPQYQAVSVFLFYSCVLFSGCNSEESLLLLASSKNGIINGNI